MRDQEKAFKFAKKFAKAVFKESDDYNDSLLRAACYTDDASSLLKAGQQGFNALKMYRTAAVLGGAANKVPYLGYMLIGADLTYRFLEWREARIEAREAQREVPLSRRPRGCYTYQKDPRRHRNHFGSNQADGKDTFLSLAKDGMNSYDFVPEGFYSELRSVRLYESYGNSQGWMPIGNYLLQGFPGGVISGKGKIQGFENSALDVLYSTHNFCMPVQNGKALFSQLELNTIISELSKSIYQLGSQGLLEKQEIYPFISLHMNDRGTLFPILHPYYRNTLVGEVIGVLDYFLKGFLNGDIFSADFIYNWEAGSNRDSAYLKTQLLGLRGLYKKNGGSYISLREKLSLSGFDPLDFNRRFQLSFRIIARQKKVSYQENTIFFEPDFSVEYSLEEVGVGGSVSEDYKKILKVCEEVAHEVHEKMPKLPLFQEYLQKLYIINFACYYLTTVKESGKTVKIGKKQEFSRIFPNELPSLPVRYFRRYPVNITLAELIEALGPKGRAELEIFLEESKSQYRKAFPDALKHILQEACRQILIQKIPDHLRTEEDLGENVLDLMRNLKKLLKKLMAGNPGHQEKIFQAMIEKFSLDIDPKLPRMAKKKFEALLAAKKAESGIYASMLNEIRPIFYGPGKRILSDKQYEKLVVMKNTRHSTLEIGLQGPMVFGGCSMDLSSLPLTEMQLPKEACYQIKEKASLQTLGLIAIENQPHVIFQLETENTQVYAPICVSEKKENHSPSESSEFFGAVISDDAKSVGLFLQKSPNLLHAKNARGANAVHVAAENGSAQVLNTLIKFGAKADEILPNNLFPIYAAILNGSRESATALIDQTPVNSTIGGGQTTLHLAIEKGDENLALALIAKGADLTIQRRMDGYMPLHLAVEIGLKSICERILSKGISANSALPSGKTPVHLAAEKGYLEILEIMLEKYQGDINQATRSKETPLMLALEAGQWACAEYLAGKVKIGDKNDLGQTASLCAALIGQFEISRILIERGEDPFETDRYGNSVIFHLLRTGQYQYYRLFSEKLKIDPNREFHGQTSLDIAVKNGYFLLAAYLRSMKAEGKFFPKPLSPQEEFYMAFEEGSKKTFGKLLKYWWERGWKDINEPHPELDFFLAYLSVDFGDAKLIPYFISRGLDYSRPCTEKGETAFHIAAQRKNSYFLKKLFKTVSRDKWPNDWRELKLKAAQSSAIREPILFSPHPDEAAILQALEAADEKSFVKLIERFPINTQFLFYKNLKRPLLHIIAKMNAEWALDYLLEHGLDPKVLDEEGGNLLHLIAESKPEKFLMQWNLLNIYFQEALPALVDMPNNQGETPISISIRQKRTGFLKTYLASGLASSHNPRIHVAVAINNWNAVEELLKEGIDVNMTNDQHQTPLMIAAQNGNAEGIQFLVSKGANPDKRDRHQHTALHYAILNGHFKAAMHLAPLTRHITRKNAFGNTPFMLASAKGFLPLMALIYKMDSNCQHRNKKGFNALHLAAQNGQTTVLEYLLSLGFSVNEYQEHEKTEKLKMTALQLAARNGHVATVIKLVLLGANPLEQDNSHSDMMDRIIESNRLEAILFFKSLKIEVKVDYFLRAAGANNIPIMIYLLEYEINHNTCNDAGKNALFIASENGAEKSVAFLLDMGIDSQARTLQGETVFHAAARAGSVNILRQLSFLAELLDIPNEAGKTPFFIACENGHYGATLFLLELGVDFNFSDKSGMTPRDIAEKNDHAEIVKVIDSRSTLKSSPR